MTISQEWVHLRYFLRQTYNDEVRRYFKDVPVKDKDPENDSGRASAMRSCLVTANDSLLLTNLKVMTFRFTVQRVHLRPHVYGVPVGVFQESVKFWPLVRLYFSQDLHSTPEGKRPVTAELSFRLHGETEKTWTLAKSEKLAQQIKLTFASNGGYRWSKGKILCTYVDPEHGYNLQIYALSETEGEEVAKKILSIRDIPFHLDKFVFHTPKKESITNPTTTKLVYGKQRKAQRWRPHATVRFRYATLQLHSVEEDIILVDRTGYWPRVLERV